MFTGRVISTNNTQCIKKAPYAMKTINIYHNCTNYISYTKESLNLKFVWKDALLIMNMLMIFKLNSFADFLLLKWSEIVNQLEKHDLCTSELPTNTLKIIMLIKEHYDVPDLFCVVILKRKYEIILDVTDICVDDFSELVYFKDWLTFLLMYRI